MKYTLHVNCEHEEKHELCVPLTLDGSESTAFAVERLRDALVVAREMMREHHGREFCTTRRIDGVPSFEEEQRYKEAAGILRNAEA